MSDTVQPGCEIPESTYKMLKNYVRDKHGTLRGNLGAEMNRAVINHVESAESGGPAARVEDDVATLNRNVNDVKQQLNELTTAIDGVESDGGGLTPSAGENTQRDDPDRSTSDAPDEPPHSRAGRVEKAEWVAAQLTDTEQIHREHDVAALIKETWGFSGDTLETLVELVLPRLPHVEHPGRTGEEILFVTEEFAEQKREELTEQAESELKDESERLNAADAEGA